MSGPEQRRGGRLAKAQRHERIIAELRSNPTVRISHLAQAFGVSTETVRRDIDDLSSRGLVARTYGGAAAPMGREPAVHERSTAMVSEREGIARVAAAMIAPGDVVMIDSGATTLHLARQLALAQPEITVITNGLEIAHSLGSRDRIRVILCPGSYAAREDGVYGQDACDFLRRFHANVALTSAGGLTSGGITDVDSNAAWIKRTMFERAARRVFLVDHAKFQVPLLEVVAPLDSLTDVVTDQPPPDALGEALATAGVTLTLAGERPNAQM